MANVIVSYNSENGTKVAKLARNFDISRTTLTATLKTKDKIISHFFSSVHTRKHDTAGGNPNQRTFLILARPGFGIELKSHFRNDLLQCAYNDAFSPVQ